MYNSTIRSINTSDLLFIINRHTEIFDIDSTLSSDEIRNLKSVALDRIYQVVHSIVTRLTFLKRLSKSIQLLQPNTNYHSVARHQKLLNYVKTLLSPITNNLFSPKIILIHTLSKCLSLLQMSSQWSSI